MAAKRKSRHARKVTSGMRKYHKRTTHRKSAAGSRKAAWARWGKKSSRKK